MRLGGFAWTAILLVALIPHCGAPCEVGAPCSQSQAGEACRSNDCESMLCDGTQYDLLKKGPGDPCTSPGATCPDPATEPSPGSCGGGTLTCGPEGTFYFKENVWPGSACNTKGAICHFPETECQSCTCDGKEWICQMSACCQPGCFEAGTCPSMDDIIAGAPCQSALSCLGAHACGFSTQKFAYCNCVGGAWSCAAMCDGG